MYCNNFIYIRLLMAFNAGILFNSKHGPLFLLSLGCGISKQRHTLGLFQLLPKEGQTRQVEGGHILGKKETSRKNL